MFIGGLYLGIIINKWVGHASNTSPWGLVYFPLVKGCGLMVIAISKMLITMGVARTLNLPGTGDTIDPRPPLVGGVLLVPRRSS